MVITYLAKGDHDQKTTDVLRAADGVLPDRAAGRRWQPGGAGRGRRDLRVRPLLSGGYWNLPDETSRTFHDGWMHTGDLDREDEDGFWYIVDRPRTR